MKPELQRIAIAEACGMFRIKPLRRTTRKGKDDPNGVKLWYCSEHHGGAAIYDEVPNYLNDLNAMHEAEKSLPDGHTYWEFIRHLDEIVKRKPLPFIADRSSATAAQRAEAFLRTLNLWQE